MVLIRVLPLGGANPIGPSPTPRSPLPSFSPSPVVLPSAGEVVGTVNVEGNITAAVEGKLFAVGAMTDRAYTLARIERDGSMTRVRIRDGLSYYVGRMAATSDAVYLGTDVIHRFTNAKDELVRIDTNKLRVTARLTLDDNISSLLADRHSVWVSIANRILQLDPSTLAVRLTIVVPGLDPAPTGSDSISLAVGRGGLWAVAGNALRATLYRLGPRSLALLGHAKIPSLPGQGYFVTATEQAVWMVYDSGIRKVDPQRASIRKLIPIPELTTAVARGTGLVAMLGGSSIAQIDGDGHVVALTENLGDIGGFVAANGPDVWMSGGAGILHFVLADVPGAS